MTIVEAIISVLKSEKTPLTIDTIFGQITARNLYAFKAVDAKAVVRSQVRRHCVNLEFSTANPIKYFRLEDNDRYILESSEGVRTSIPAKKPQAAGRVPEEAIEAAHHEHLLGLRQQLKSKILENHPVFFEHLVIELLIKMGYGASDPTLGIHRGGPGDGGIDGEIKEDRLGLEKIYIQAKCYALERPVKPEEVREFAGAMNKAKKGVFITTSRFAKTAEEFVLSHEKSIKLVDGDELCDLMIRYGVGVSEVANYRVLRIDNDYFSQES